MRAQGLSPTLKELQAAIQNAGASGTMERRKPRAETGLAVACLFVLFLFANITSRPFVTIHV